MYYLPSPGQTDFLTLQILDTWPAPQISRFMSFKAVGNGVYYINPDSILNYLISPFTIAHLIIL